MVHDTQTAMVVTKQIEQTEIKAQESNRYTAEVQNHWAT